MSHPGNSAEQMPSPYENAQTHDGRYRLLVEGIIDYAIYMLDPTGIVTTWNAGAERFKGYRAEEVIGRHFSLFYTPEDKASGLPARALRTSELEGKFENEGWCVRKDGTRFWASVVIDPIRGTDGKLVGFSKVTRDLTERRIAEEHLRASQQQFRLLVEGVTDYAIYMLSPTGHVTSWNPGAQRIKGYAPEEIIGSHFSRFYTAEDQKNGEPERALEIAARVGRFEKEGRRVRKSGVVFWANVVIDAVRRPDGTLLGFAKITRDITEQREARLALERTRESLFHAQKLDAIGQLTGGVAHDFNNLLTAILGSLDLLRKRLPDDPKARALLENALQGAQRGAALTQRMLAFARRQDLALERINIPALVQGMSDLLERSLSPSVELEMRFPLKISPVLTDPNQLELALLNLVTNARDAMPAGGRIIVSATESELQDESNEATSRRFVCLSVTDTGEGMDETTLAKATEPFFTTKGVGKGTGLGLPMVHGLAEQSGGRLILKSRKGEGTTAQLWLPVCTAGQEVRMEATQTKPAASMRPLVVLAVDDDQLVLNNTIAMLEDLGHEACSASSAAEALDVLRTGTHIDLVITDHVMPGMTGAQLSQIIATESPSVALLLASGYAELPVGTSAPINKLAKPFGLDALAKAIAVTIQSKQPRADVIRLR
jgi:PAS domain S-box-containing protein